MNLNKTLLFVKITFFTTFLIISFPNLSTAEKPSEILASKWNKVCKKNLPQNCLMIIKGVLSGSDKKLKTTLAYAYIELGSKTKKTMNLIDAKEQTFKLGEKKTDIPVMFADLPLNLDLRFKPLILIDDQQILQLEYITCLQKVGCKSIAVLNEKQLQLFKKGKSLDIFVVPFGNKSNQGFKINFPLKGFTKSYDQLSLLKK